METGKEQSKVKDATSNLVMQKERGQGPYRTGCSKILGKNIQTLASLNKKLENKYLLIIKYY